MIMPGAGVLSIFCRTRAQLVVHSLESHPLELKFPERKSDFAKIES